MFEGVSFVIRSRYRLAIMLALERGPALPSVMAHSVGISSAHVSRALAELSKQRLVQCLTSASKGRIYSLTKLGSKVLNDARTLKMLPPS